jgi:uncharacterized membrane protein
MNETQIPSNKPSQEEKIWAVLSYIWVLSIVALLVRKEKFVHDHAKQGFLIFVGECFMFIPVINFLFGWIIGLAAFILAIVGIIKALAGETWKIPFIGEWWDQKIKM